MLIAIPVDPSQNKAGTCEYSPWHEGSCCTVNCPGKTQQFRQLLGSIASCGGGIPIDIRCVDDGKCSPNYTNSGQEPGASLDEGVGYGVNTHVPGTNLPASVPVLNAKGDWHEPCPRDIPVWDGKYPVLAICGLAGQGQLAVPKDSIPYYGHNGDLTWMHPSLIDHESCSTSGVTCETTFACSLGGGLDCTKGLERVKSVLAAKGNRPPTVEELMGITPGQCKNALPPPPGKPATGNLCTGPIRDNIIDGYEECDFLNLNGKTCQGLGFSGGKLKCSSTCRFNTSECTGTLQ